MMVAKPKEPGVYVVLIHWLARRKGDIVLGVDIENYKTFVVDKLLSGKYRGEQFAPNIKPVLRNYQYLLKRGILAKL
ncbi:MAG: hypothetical protein ACKKL5_01800 [Candidatus Komeilibacteria bacterium]